MNPTTEIVNELKKTNRLLAIVALRDLGSKTEQILLLNEVGFKPSEIAPLIGTTANNVSVTLAKAKSKRKAKQ